METLPEDILGEIYKYLDRQYWLSILCTSKRWNKKGKEVFDPSFDNNLAIRRAWYAILTTVSYCSLNGRVEVVKNLLKDKRVDPRARNNESIRWARL